MIVIYISFEARHEQSQLKIEQSNAQKIDTLVHDLKSQYDNVVANLDLSDNLERSSSEEVSTLKIQENWGNSDYTCLYRFRVHGEAEL